MQHRTTPFEDLTATLHAQLAKEDWPAAYQTLLARGNWLAQYSSCAPGKVLAEANPNLLAKEQQFMSQIQTHMRQIQSQLSKFRQAKQKTNKYKVTPETTLLTGKVTRGFA